MSSTTSMKLEINDKRSIAVELKPSPFHNLLAYEPINIERLVKLINSNLLARISNEIYEQIYENEKNQLITYLQRWDGEKCVISYEKKEVGRCKARAGMCLLNIRRQIRHTIARDTMVDIDIDNCHPVLMIQMLDKIGFDAPCLKSYVSNRQQWFDIVNNAYGILEKNGYDAIQRKELPKNLFIRLLYLGQIFKWISDMKLDKNVPIPIEILRFQDELKRIGMKFMELNPALAEEFQKKKRQIDASNNRKRDNLIKKIREEYPSVVFTDSNESIDITGMSDDQIMKAYRDDRIKLFKDALNKTNDVKFDYLNVPGSLTSTVMQQKENEILEVIYTYLVSIDVIDDRRIFALCADGLMISKDKYSTELLSDLERVIQEKTGFKVKLSMKEMNQGYTDEELDSNQISNSYRFGEVNTELIQCIHDVCRTPMEKYMNSDYGSDFNPSNVVMLNDMVSYSMKAIGSYKCSICNVQHKSGSMRTVCSELSGNISVKCHSKSRLIWFDSCGDKLDKIGRKAKCSSVVEDLFAVNTFGLTLIHENSRYIGFDDSACNYIDRLEYRKKFLVLSAQMGKGKTTFLKYFLQWRENYRREQVINAFFNGDQALSDKLSDRPRLSYLFISQRKTFTNFVCAEFPDLKSYLNIGSEGYDEHDRVCIQIESLHKTNRRYDVVVIDEVETVLSQFSSSTMKKCQGSFAVFKEVIRNAESVVCADAFVMQRTVDFLSSFVEDKSDIVFIRNTKLFLEGRKAIQISQDKFNGHLCDSLSSGNRIVNVSSSRSDLIDLEALLREQCTEESIQTYDRYCKKSDLSRVNETWENLDYVGYTPVIQTGISYTGKSFDVCYANLKSSNLCRDAMQMLLRARHLNKNEIYFSLNKRLILNANDSRMFSNYNDFLGDSKDRILSLVCLLKENKKANKGLIDTLENMLVTTDKDLMRILWHNLRESVVSSTYYNMMCIYLLKIQGYDVVLLPEGTTKDRKADREGRDLVNEYLGIEDIDTDVCTKYSNLKMQDKAGKEQCLSVDKFYFESILVPDVSLEVKAKLFFSYFQVSGNRSKIENVRYEKGNLSYEAIVDRDVCKADSIASKLRMTAVKLKHIREFNRILGLRDSSHVGAIVDKDIVQGDFTDYIKANIHELRNVFGHKLHLDGRQAVDSARDVTKFLCDVYKMWSGLTFKTFGPQKKGCYTQYKSGGDPLIDSFKAYKSSPSVVVNIDNVIESQESTGEF